MSKRIVTPASLPPPRGFNHGILTEGGRILWLAGQDASGPDGVIAAPDDLVAQYEQVLRNLQAVVEEAGGTMQGLGRSLFGDYLFAVEMAGTLLLVASIGAIAVAPRRAEGTL